MAAGFLSLNHEGELFQVNVTGVASALVLPTYKDPASNMTVTRTPAHMLIYTDKTVRWRADGTDPNPDMGMPLLAGTFLNFLEPNTDFSGIIQRIKFCTMAGTVGNATLDVALFT